MGQDQKSQAPGPLCQVGARSLEDTFHQPRLPPLGSEAPSPPSLGAAHWDLTLPGVVASQGTREVAEPA